MGSKKSIRDERSAEVLYEPTKETMTGTTARAGSIARKNSPAPNTKDARMFLFCVRSAMMPPVKYPMTPPKSVTLITLAHTGMVAPTDGSKIRNPIISSVKIANPATKTVHFVRRELLICLRYHSAAIVSMVYFKKCRQ